MSLVLNNWTLVFSDLLFCTATLLLLCSVVTPVMRRGWGRGGGVVSNADTKSIGWQHLCLRNTATTTITYKTAYSVECKKV